MAYSDWLRMEAGLPPGVPDAARDALRQQYVESALRPYAAQTQQDFDTLKADFLKFSERPTKTANPNLDAFAAGAEKGWTGTLAGAVEGLAQIPQWVQSKVLPERVAAAANAPFQAIQQQAGTVKRTLDEAAARTQQEAMRQSVGQPNPVRAALLAGKTGVPRETTEGSENLAQVAGLAGQIAGEGPMFAGVGPVAGAVKGAMGAAPALAQAIIPGAASLGLIQGAIETARADNGQRLSAGLHGAAWGAGLGGLFGGLHRWLKPEDTRHLADTAALGDMADPAAVARAAAITQKAGGPEKLADVLLLEAQNAARKAESLGVANEVLVQPGEKMVVSLRLPPAPQPKPQAGQPPVAPPQPQRFQVEIPEGDGMEAALGKILGHVRQPGAAIETITAPNQAAAFQVLKSIERQNAAAITRPVGRPAIPNVSAEEGERAGVLALPHLQQGPPGVSVQPDKFLNRKRFIVYRDDAGKPKGYLSFYLDDSLRSVAPPDHGLYPEVYVSPDARRRGIASQLYSAAEKMGYDLSLVSGSETTPAGAAFLNARRGSNFPLPERAITYGLRTVDDIEHAFKQAGWSFEMDRGMYWVQKGETRKAFKRLDALKDFADRTVGEPSAAPSLVDDTLIPPSVMEAAGAGRGPTGQPTTASYTPGDPGFWNRGLAAVGSWFRPADSVVESIAAKTGSPQVAATWRRIRNGERMAQDIARRETPLAFEATGGAEVSDPLRRKAIGAYVDAPAADKDRLAMELGLSERELKAARDSAALWERYYGEFRVGAPHLEDYFPHMKELQKQGVRFGSEGPVPKTQQWSADMVRRGLMDPYDLDIRRVMSNYIRGGLRSRYVDPAVDDFMAAVEGARPTMGEANYSALKRAAEHMKHIPAKSDAWVMTGLNGLADGYNSAISKVNRVLPKAVNLPHIESRDQELLAKYFNNSYLGYMGFRPDVLLRDGLKFMLDLPVYGRYTFKGIGEAVTGKGAAQLAHRYHALIERGGGLAELAGGGEAMMPKWKQMALDALSLVDNQVRTVNFMGASEMVQDALKKWTRSGDAKEFIADSGLWILRPNDRTHYLAELMGMRPDRWKDYSYRVASDLVNKTSWRIEHGAQPGLQKTAMGRLFGQFGVWPLNYIQHQRDIIAAARDPLTRKPAMKALAATVAVHGAIAGMATKAGIEGMDLVFYGPASWAGGPLLDIALAAPEALAHGRRGDEARSTLTRTVPGMMVPGAVVIDRLWRAADSKSDDEAVRIMMGVRQIKGKHRESWAHEIFE